jgi:multidrug efflux pump subunit AcrA (membrane-fusion protein)
MIASHPTNIAGSSSYAGPLNNARYFGDSEDGNGNRHHQLRDHLAQLAAATELTARITQGEDRQTTCQILAEALESYFSANRVLVAVVSPNDQRCLVQGRSPQDLPDRDDVTRWEGAAMQEALWLDRNVSWPPTDDQRYGLRAHQQLSEIVGGEHLQSFLVRDTFGDPRAVILIGHETLDPHGSTKALGFLELVAPAIANVLRLHQLQDPCWLARVIDISWNRLRVQPLGSWGVVASILLIVALLPVRYRIDAPCTIQPRTKRYVTAPFDSRLAQAMVRPGDLVESEETLATLEGDDLLLELEQARAELHQARKERVGYLATHASGKAKLSEHEVERLESKTRMLELRAATLELKSPLQGIVVTGDLKDRVGAPLKTGTVLYEIAPLDEMLVEVRIPEREIAYVHIGLPVHLEFSALPFRTLSATIEEIHPRAELIDQEYVFVAKMRLANSQHDLRPGMSGEARIFGQRLPWAWNWIRRPLAALASLLRW